jgi:ankyrin repeat protein
MWDLPLLVQKEVQNDLERRANEQPSEMSEEDKLRKQFLWGKAAYLLFILVQNWQGIQDSNSGMRWLIRAASNGYFAGRAELPRVVAATDFQLSEDLQAAMSDWLNSCIPFYQDRFILDTIEDMNPLSYHQLDDRVRASWATGPFLPGLFGDEWLFALYNAITEYCSVAHVFENSYTTLSDYFGAVYSAIQGNTMSLLEFLFTPSANSGESRLYKDYGNGLTWVHFCAVIGLIEVFQHAGFDPGTIDTQDNLGRTALYFATVCGNSHAVLCLLELGADGSLGCDDKGNTILHFANIFRRGDIAKVVELLVESGADVNALNNKLETPIHKVIQGTFSARSNYVALIALLDRGADPSLCDVDGDVAHCWAITTLQAKSLELLLRGIKTKLSSPDLLLLKADLLDRFMCVPQSEKLALAGPEYPACIDSILQLVVDEETFEIFKELPDNNGDSAFFSASFRAAADIMTSLRKLWPSVDIDECEHEYGRPPLCYAIRHGKQTIFDLLVDLGADISYQENTQENALHAAAEYAPAMLEKILDVCHSANCLDKMVKTISSHGHTPFDTAVINGHINAARLLSKYGVDLNSARCIGYGGIHTTTLGYILQIPATSVAEVAFLLDLGSQGVVSKDLSSVFHALATRRNELQDEGMQTL